MRIVSLLPSTTEILFAIGAGDDVVGVTFECDHPSEARSRPIVSTSSLPAGLTPAQIDAEVRTRIAAGEDLYSLDAGALAGLGAEVVVTQDLCRVCAVDVGNVDAALDHLGCDAEVVTIDPGTLDEVLESIVVLGELTGHQGEAMELVGQLRRRLDAVARRLSGEPRRSVVVLEWTDPYFCAGHWVPDLVAAAGGEPVTGLPGQRSRQIEPADVAAADPDVVVVAPCGYRLEGATALAMQVRDSGVVPVGAELWAIDADALITRPGPRLVDGVESLAAIVHPNLFSLPAGTAALVR